MTDAPDDLEQLIADGFVDVPTVAGKDFVRALMEASREHGGRWPSHATACRAQVIRWCVELMEPHVEDAGWRPEKLHIMGTAIIERPGPITLIWTERLKAPVNK